MSLKQTNVTELGRLPAFGHRVQAGGFLVVSGTLGIAPGTEVLVENGVGPQMPQASRNIETILKHTGVSLSGVDKVNVLFQDMAAFDEMNRACPDAMKTEPPARITAERTELALDVLAEIDCIAHQQEPIPCA